ncbi:hypothetical protein Pyn_26116 [Prunus yedoensis var. nudiflora]|uniref:Uncharacterized protein n=1 Tax=Prunus yedoensis var. nudiflora TaxID=2094558 RepID=A0A314UP58_PRUYE|nr:hypothetical protein Pyn_26116 [Prunus yedoensis var. nudiflora]
MRRLSDSFEAPVVSHLGRLKGRPYVLFNRPNIPGRDEIFVPEPPIFVKRIATHPGRQSTEGHPLSGVERRYWPRRGAGRCRPSRTRAGWLTAGEARPSGSGRIAAPRSSTDKSRPRT